MKSVLVTGGTGYIAGGLIRELLARGAERVCIFSRSESRQAEMRQSMNDSRLRYFIGDVRDQARLRRAMDGVDTVIHTAALKRIEVGFYDPIEMVRTNVDGTVNVIEAATQAAVQRVMFVSTDKAYQPASAYGHSKALAESLVLAANHSRGSHGPRFAACRFGNVWNSTGSIVPSWKARIARGERVVPVTDPHCTRFFMRLHEAVALVLDTAEHMQGGELAIPDLPAYSVGDLAQAFGVGMHVTGLPAFEKRDESMSADRCSRDARRMTVEELEGELCEALTT